MGLALGPERMGGVMVLGSGRKEACPGGLNVKFQQVVVHSIENCEAGVAKQQLEQETELTITIMPE